MGPQSSGLRGTGIHGDLEETSLAVVGNVVLTAGRTGPSS